MKILLLGHKGMLGHDLLRRLGGVHDLTGKDIDDFDITSADACRDVIAEAQPELVINAAAYTNVDGCETDQATCFAVNGDGVRNVIMACCDRNIRIVHFSTDYVFDGTKGEAYQEEDACNPLSVYGRSKLAGERYLQEMAKNYLLIRTEWLYGVNGKNFVNTMVDKAKTVKTLEVVDDQIGSPTYTEDLAAAVQILIEGGHSGTFHVTNRGNCSWFDFAVKIFQYKGLPDVTVLPIKSEQLARPAKRPAYSVLNCRKFLHATGRTMRFWQIALQDYLEKMAY